MARHNYTPPYPPQSNEKAGSLVLFVPLGARSSLRNESTAARFAVQSSANETRTFAKVPNVLYIYFLLDRHIWSAFLLPVVFRNSSKTISVLIIVVIFRSSFVFVVVFFWFIFMNCYKLEGGGDRIKHTTTSSTTTRRLQNFPLDPFSPYPHYFSTNR